MVLTFILAIHYLIPIEVKDPSFRSNFGTSIQQSSGSHATRLHLRDALPVIGVPHAARSLEPGWV